MQTFEKTNEQIKSQIMNWFLKYMRISDFNGNEEFTIFDKIPLEEQEIINPFLDSDELPVLVLKKINEVLIVCTTKRFINIENNTIQVLKYSDFKEHLGYKYILVDGEMKKNKEVKTNGYIAEFGLVKTNEDIIYWKIPTGNSGFSFWNITKKFDIIGRKYRIKQID